MKRDAMIVVTGSIVIGAICYALAAVRPPFEPTKSSPFSTAPVGPTVSGRVVMRVNGEPITENEFQAAFEQLPDELKRQFASAPGKQAFAEQLVRMKILEQEARRLGVDRDPKIEAQLAAERMNLLASAAAEKLVANPTSEAVQSFYKANSGRFQTLEVSHILIAYAGGSVPPRDGETPPTEAVATQRALVIRQHLLKGADFAELARKLSDDTASAERGGSLGPLSRGMLPPDVDAQVFKLAPGEISGPILSRYGVHIFKVTGRGTAPLRQVSAGISRHVKQQNMFDRVEALRKITKVDFDPKFFPDAKTWGKNPS